MYHLFRLKWKARTSLLLFIVFLFLNFLFQNFSCNIKEGLFVYGLIFRYIASVSQNPNFTKFAQDFNKIAQQHCGKATGTQALYFVEEDSILDRLLATEEQTDPSETDLTEPTETPTENPTKPPTKPRTELATKPTTEFPTKPSTKAPTEPPTKPTKPTESPPSK